MEKTEKITLRGLQNSVQGLITHEANFHRKLKAFLVNTAKFAIEKQGNSNFQFLSELVNGLSRSSVKVSQLIYFIEDNFGIKYNSMTKAFHFPKGWYNTIDVDLITSRTIFKTTQKREQAKEQQEAEKQEKKEKKEASATDSVTDSAINGATAEAIKPEEKLAYFKQFSAWLNKLDAQTLLDNEELIRSTIDLAFTKARATAEEKAEKAKADAEAKAERKEKLVA